MPYAGIPDNENACVYLSHVIDMLEGCANAIGRAPAPLPIKFPKPYTGPIKFHESKEILNSDKLER